MTQIAHRVVVMREGQILEGDELETVGHRHSCGCWGTITVSLFGFSPELAR